MSLFGSLMGDMDDDLFMSNPMNAMNMQMRSMNRLMNSFMPDPFNMLAPFDPGFQQNALMERQQHMSPFTGLFGFPAMPNMNRLLNADIGNPNGAAYCSSSVVSYTAGPDGRPQIYQATSSTKTGPGGVRETRKTVHDSTKGIKKMAIGHHIGERAHIIEKEQDINSGQLEERQEFVNLDEEEAEDFDREFTTKVSGSAPRGVATHHGGMLTIEPVDDDDEDVVGTSRHPQRQHRRQLPALPAPPSPHQQQQQSNGSTVTITEVSDNDEDTTTDTSPATDNSQRNNINNNNNYLPMNARRVYRNHLSAANGATPRRPLRTPTSSPLATTMLPTTITTPSVHHPHPYHTNASRRHHHHQQRSNKHAQKHHQQTTTPAATVDLTADDGASITEVEQKKPKMSEN